MLLELLWSIFDTVRGKIFKHSIVTVQNLNEVMCKKELLENNRHILKRSLYDNLSGFAFLADKLRNYN